MVTLTVFAITAWAANTMTAVVSRTSDLLAQCILLLFNIIVLLLVIVMVLL
ncbi:MAG: hypothetical protein ACE5D4_07890 [Thermodesulfobacteriota bacterium]